MTDLSRKSNDTSPNMRAFLERLEGKLVDVMCKTRPTDPQWQSFDELMKTSLAATLAEFPEVEVGAVGPALARPEQSLIDDALRELRAMVNVALQQAGMSGEVVKLLLEWIDFSVQARCLQFRIADMRFKLNASVDAE